MQKFGGVVPAAQSPGIARSALLQVQQGKKERVKGNRHDARQQDGGLVGTGEEESGHGS
ncbi:MAG: hypothetical protein VKO39_14165 [Cyanobacteriota bacterium]|nr:hypothetical protein [Cyanobacteriota bacterium]